jgi:hypothetical protein
MTSTKWKFPDQPSGLTDYHSIPTEKALDSELETFVREVLQNANDQGLADDEPVKVTFKFNELTDGLDDFLEALQWDNQTDEPENLGWHVRRATENEQARDPGLKRFIEGFNREKLLVLSIHDENTTGLIGEEDDSSDPFGALVKDFGGSEKPESSSGGSHGVGKTVLWAFSSVSTVLFNSTPNEHPDERTPPRLIGRSILPAHDHEDDDKTYTNHGWFGLNAEEDISRLGRPPSIWNDDGTASELADSLCVGREEMGTGTSIGVVGFRVPGEDLHPDPEELVNDISHAAVKHFWPAIARDDLVVKIRTPDGTERKVDWDAAPGVKPFAKCYGELFDVDTAELDGPGSIAKTKVPVTVPKENDAVIDSPDPEYETAGDLLIRQLTPEDKEDLETDDDRDLEANRVARLRGAQMIVDYVDQSSVANRGSDFVSVLVCGEAQSPNGDTPSDEQKALEKFLKRSEPTQHDNWQGSKNDYLKKHYSGTIVKEIAALAGERLERALAEVVHEEVDSGEEVPGMDDIATIMDGRSTDGNGAGSVMEWKEKPRAWFDDGRWYFEGAGGPDVDEHGEWDVTIELDRLDVDASESDSVPVESVTPLTGGVTVVDAGEGKKLEIPSSIDEVEFEGSSDPVIQSSGDVTEAFEIGDITEVRLDVSASVETEGSG